jgi:hypothetical protein
MLDRKETVEVLPSGSQRHLRTRRKAETNRTLMWPSAESASLWRCGEQDVSLAARRNEANSRRDYSHCRPRAERACSPRRTASRALQSPPTDISRNRVKRDFSRFISCHYQLQLQLCHHYALPFKTSLQIAFLGSILVLIYVVE